MELRTLIERIRNEFLEMPGMQLTPQQAARLWGLEPASCDRVIAALVATRFLRWTPKGRIMRVDHTTDVDLPPVWRVA